MKIDPRFIGLDKVDPIGKIRLQPPIYDNGNIPTVKELEIGEIFFDRQARTWKGYDGISIRDIAFEQGDIFLFIDDYHIQPVDIWKDNQKLESLKFSFENGEWNIKISDAVLRITNNLNSFEINIGDVSKQISQINFENVNNSFAIGINDFYHIIKSNIPDWAFTFLNYREYYLLYSDFPVLTPSGQINFYLGVMQQGFPSNIFRGFRIKVDFNSNKTTIFSYGNLEFSSPFALPNWTTNSRPLNPSPGVIGFNSETGQFEGWNGTSWVILG